MFSEDGLQARHANANVKLTFCFSEKMNTNNVRFNDSKCSEIVILSSLADINLFKPFLCVALAQKCLFSLIVIPVSPALCHCSSATLAHLQLNKVPVSDGVYSFSLVNITVNTLTHCLSTQSCAFFRAGLSNQLINQSLYRSVRNANGKAQWWLSKLGACHNVPSNWRRMLAVFKWLSDQLTLPLPHLTFSQTKGFR